MGPLRGHYLKAYSAFGKTTGNIFIIFNTSSISVFYLDSERSEECIDFTMMCVFFLFVSVYTRTCRNNASISNFGGGF
ncbi:Uncharacterized protein FWK35_00022224 [Aphis craccivora]|uniref:Uncharacterized protein n=1 Tax=Aphis craccivora TaxID=307492 RepID=A0A6G0YU93_APHCR|nr:Uncharacterized protein FWK35_00022224 [Aphis craccivora]